MGVQRLRELSLFSGAGGGLYATQYLLGWQTVAYCEIDPYCRRVLKQRIKDGIFDDAPIWDDASTFPGEEFRGKVDVISAGFPCQPFSVAGRGKGKADKRNGWPWVIRCVRQVRPRYLFLENVPGLLAGSHGYFGQILSELSAERYDVRWACLSAAQCGAPHKRNRLWIVATDTQRSLVRDEPGGWCGKSGDTAPKSPAYGETQHVADAERAGWWATGTEICRVAHGLANRKQRLTALGNGQCSVVAATAWRLLGG